MSSIDVLVAAISADVKAEVIAASVASREDMRLVAGRCVKTAEIDDLLASLPRHPCALVLVGAPADTGPVGQRWLADRIDLVVLHVDVLGDVVRITMRDPALESLLSSLRGLVERLGAQGHDRVARVRLGGSTGAGGESEGQAPTAPLLQAAVAWARQVLRGAVEAIPDDNGDVHGFSVSRATLLQTLDAAEWSAERAARWAEADMERALDAARLASEASIEPLAVAARALELDGLSFRMLALALAPELDVRLQRCLGFLLDDMGRRVGTLGLYSSLLGTPTEVRRALAEGGGLARWMAFEEAGSRPAGADEPLRLDPFLAQWLLGDRLALGRDPRVRRALRTSPWAGADLLQRREDRVEALGLIDRLLAAGGPGWVLLGGANPAAWRALLELGTRSRNTEPIRVEPGRLGPLDAIQVEDCARLVGRMARLTGLPLVVDAAAVDGGEEGAALRAFLGGLQLAASRPTVICREEARIVALVGSSPCEVLHQVPLDTTAHLAAVRAAAAGAGASLPEDAAAELARRYPLGLDGWENAMHLAHSRPPRPGAEALAAFTAACEEVAAEGLSNLAERIEPGFGLDQVVLPADRKQQLLEIVDHVRLASRVLDEWRFGEQLPYGRGVSALFFGPSGTGKTMAALGIARRLGIQLLRLDLAQVVSKYIGETEKNIDRVFGDAQRSGSLLLIDEADALLGKRTEVADAHARYSNLEVAHLLQRMEAYEGLVVLTTNLRQNLDAAFLRRLRFIIEFPRPDQEARERIWRQCLPGVAHRLDDAAFRQLAKRIDLTGGHIRQIALHAAFSAAAAGELVGLPHLQRAARAELAKLGLPPVELDRGQGQRAA